MFLKNLLFLTYPMTLPHHSRPKFLKNLPHH
jgi:hypothetical protein